MESETQVMAKWFADSSMKANADKFQRSVLPGNRKSADVNVTLRDIDTEFKQKTYVLGVCWDGKSSFNVLSLMRPNLRFTTFDRTSRLSE